MQGRRIRSGAGGALSSCQSHEEDAAMKVAGAKVLVTGANRGLGKALVRGLRDAGAAKIYAGARNAQTITPAAGVEPVALDITKPEQSPRRPRAAPMSIFSSTTPVLR